MKTISNVSPETIKAIKSKKAEIIAEMIFPKMDGDNTTSSEVMEMAQEITTDQEVVDMVLELIEDLLYPEGEEMNEDPGIEAAEEQFAAEEDSYYAELGDSESEN